MVTHVGDVQAAMLVQMRVGAVLKRPVNISLETAHFQSGVDYVNVGGPTFNVATKNLLDSLSTSFLIPYKFKFQDGKWLLEGKHDSFEISVSPDRQVTEDFGLIAKLPHPRAIPGGDHLGFTVILAGLSTLGTFGAGIFATDPGTIPLLKTYLKRYPSKEREYFCAIVRVKPKKSGFGVDEQMLALRDAKPVVRKSDV
jgi:hypothetical protein